MNKKQNIGWGMVILLSVFPCILWIISPYSSKSLASLDLILLEVGQITALIGTAMFALTLLLSARLKIFDTVFRGMNEAYEKHNQLGQLALILLLVHPLSLLPSYATSFAGAAGFFLPGSQWAMNWGIFSLFLMLVLIILTLYLRPKYNLWKWTHKFLGVAFFMGALHGWMISSTVSQDMLLRTYLFTIVAIGLLAFAYRTLLGFFLVTRYSYIVTGINQINPEILQIEMKPKGKHMNYAAGQFIFISFKDSKVSSEVHPFSISSDPKNETLEIIVKNLGDYTASLSEITIGAEAKIEGPYGIFSFRNKPSKNQIWIAAGIGITPFLGMARSLTPEDDYQIDLYYCVQDETETIYSSEMEEISKKLNGKLRVIGHPSKTCGRINAELIEKQSQTLQGKDILLCAPAMMIRALRKQFKQKGIPDSCVHSEEFSF